MTEKEIVSLIKEDEEMMSTLRSIHGLSLPDWWIGAGFVRNKVWDELHGYKERTPLNDIDVIYFNEYDVWETSEIAIEKQLQHLHPGLPWSVKNQARMAMMRGDGPYKDAEDGLSRWVETATCIGVRLNDKGELELAAPLGVEDLVHLVLRKNRKANVSDEVFRERVTQKKWLDIWPKLRIASE